MKMKSPLLTLIAKSGFLIALLLSFAAAPAASYNWTNQVPVAPLTNGNWSTAINWINNTAPVSGLTTTNQFFAGRIVTNTSPGTTVQVNITNDFASPFFLNQLDLAGSGAGYYTNGAGNSNGWLQVNIRGNQISFTNNGSAGPLLRCSVSAPANGSNMTYNVYTPIDLNTNTLSIIPSTTASVNLYGVISGTGGLWVSNNAALGLVNTPNREGVVLLATNSFTGPTIIAAGSLAVGTSNGVGFSSIIVSNSAQFRIHGTLTPMPVFTNSLTLVNGGILFSRGGNATYAWTGPIILNGGGTIRGYGANPLIHNLAGGISGSGPLTLIGAGNTGTSNVFVFSAPCSYSGETILQTAGGNGGSRLVITNADNQLPVTTLLGSILADSVTSNKLVLNGYNQRLAGLTNSASGFHYVVNGRTGTPTFTISNSANCAYSGYFGGGLANENNFAFVKNGSGTFTFGGIGTLNGGTTVSNGTLVVSGSLGAVTAYGGALTVSGTAGAVTMNGGILTGTGTNTGLTTINTGGSFNPGAVGTAGTLAAAGGLTLASGAAVTFDLSGANTVGGGVNDLVAITGSPTFNNNTIVINQLAPVATGVPYTLFTYTGGSHSGTIGSISGIGRQTYTINYDDTPGAGSVTVTFGASAAAPLVWNSPSSTVWDVQTTANWTNTATLAQDTFYQNDNVTFDDTTGVQTGITLDTTVTPTSVTVNSSANNFSISGTGKISGLGSLTKDGSSTLTISTTNDYSGGTAINGGILRISGGPNLLPASGTVTLANTAGATLDLNGNNQSVAVLSGGGATGGNVALGGANMTVTGTSSYAGAISGNGKIIKSGAGTLTLSGANTYSGSAVVTGGGTLALGASDVLPNSSAVSVTNATLDLGASHTDTVGTLTLTNGVITGSGSSALETTGSFELLSGSVGVILAGSGALNKGGAGNLTNTAANTYTGGTVINGGGLLYLGNPSGESLPAGNVTLKNGYLRLLNSGQIADSVVLNFDDTAAARFQLNGNNETIAGLQCTGTVFNQIVELQETPSSQTSTLTLDVPSGQTNVFYGWVREGGTPTSSALSIVKNGAGTQVFSRNNAQVSYAGATVINNGVLEYSGANTVANNSAMTVNSGGTVKFSGGGTRSSNIGGGGVVYKDGANTLTLSGTNTYTGDTIINAGTLTLTNSQAGDIGAGGNIINNGILTVGSAVDQSLTNTVSGSGQLNKLGTGTLTLSGNNSHSGGTTISTANSFIKLNHANALGTGPLTNSVTNGRIIAGVDLSAGSGLINNIVTASSMYLDTTNNNVKLAGNLSCSAGNVTLVKMGTGTMTVAGTMNILGSPRVDNGDLNIASGGMLNATNSIVVGQVVGQLGSLTVQPGAVMLGLHILVPNVAGSTGLVNQVGGTVGITNDVRLGQAASAYPARYNLSGGTLTVGNLYMSYSGTGPSAGEFNMTGGQLNVLAGKMVVGRDGAATNGVGYFWQSGGTATVNQLTIGGNTTSSVNNYGQVVISNAVFTVTNFLQLGGGSYGTGIVVVAQGSVVTLPAFPTAHGLSAYSELTFDGGTLIPRLASANYISNLTAAYITANGATFSVPSGSDITVPQPFQNAPSQTGKLVKTGVGSLTLSGANTYTGDTTVSNGMLFINGSVAGAVTAQGGTLSGSGTCGGNTTVAANAGLNAGGSAGGLGTLSVSGDLTLSTDATVTFELGAAAAGANDLVAVSGSGNLNLNNNAITINPSGALEAGVPYTIMTFTGTRTGSLGTLTVNGRQTGTVTYDDAPGAGKVQVTFTSAPELVWNSSSSSVWDIQNTANWTNTSSLVSPDVFYQGDFVKFDDAAGVQTSINLDVTATPGSVMVNSSGNNFTISGTGKISGAGGLTKDGSSTLTISTTNDYTGATTVNGGMVRISGGANLLSTNSPVTLANAVGATLDLNGNNQTLAALAGGGGSGGNVTLGAGNLTVNGTNSTTYSGVISGAGSLTKNGNSTLTLSGGNSYTGSTTLSGGTLALGAAGAIPAGTVLTVNGGALDAAGQSLSVSNFSGVGGVITNTTSMTTDQNVSNLFAGVLTGSGTFTKTGTNTLFLTGINTLTGPLLVNNGALASGAGATGMVATASMVIVTNNAQLAYLAGTGGLCTNYAPLTLSDNGTNGTVRRNMGALVVWGNSAVLHQNAPVTLESVNGAPVRIGGYGATTTVHHNNTISGTGPLNLMAWGGGTLHWGYIYLNAANTYSGGTMLDCALANNIATLGVDNALPVTTVLTNGIYSDALSGGRTNYSKLILNGHNQTLAGIISQTNYNNFATNRIVGGSATLSTLTVNNTDDFTYVAVLGGGGTSEDNLAFVKSGTGSLTLTRANTYTGSTTVSGGALVINGSLATSSTTVNSSGTLGGVGTVNNSVVVNSGGKLSAGSSGTGTLTVTGNLDITDGTILCDLTNALNADKIVVAGTLNPTGVTTIDLGTSPLLTNGTYTLIEVTGTLGGTAANFTTTTPVGQRTHTIIYEYGSPNKVLLQVSGAPENITWTGDGGANLWDYITSTNWILGLNKVGFNTNDTVNFTDLGATNPTVDISGVLIPGSVTVNTSSNYLFQGAGSIDGSGGLTKSGTGILTIANANSFAGAVSINGGEVVAANNTALGSTAGSVTVSAGATLGLSNNVIVGAKALSIVGDGFNALGALQNISGNNTWGGNIAADTGTSQVRIYSLSGNLLITGNVTNFGAGNFVLQGDGNGEISGVISGSRTLFKSSNGAGTWILSGANTYDANTTVANGTIQISSEQNLGVTPAAVQASRLNLTGGTLRTTASLTLSTNRGVNIGVSLTGGGNGGRFHTDTNTILTVDSIIQGTGETNPVVKLGSGTLVLNRVNTYRGDTVVSNGILLVNGSVTTNTLVQSGGTLGGSGTVGGPATFNAGSRALLTLGSPLTFSSSLTVAGSTDVHLNLSNNVPVGVYTLAVCASSSGSFNSAPVIDSGSLAANTAASVVTTGGAVELHVVLSTLSTTLSLASSVNPSEYGQLVTFTATVQTNGVTAASATSNVVFSVGGSPVFTNALTSGQAQYSTSVLGLGTHVVGAQYLGDANYLGSTAANTNQVVNVVGTTTNMDLSVSGGTVTLTWPASHLGWVVQSNAVDLASEPDWHNIDSTTNGTSYNATVDPAQPNVFYRLRTPSP